MSGKFGFQSRDKRASAGFSPSDDFDDDIAPSGNTGGKKSGKGFDIKEAVGSIKLPKLPKLPFGKKSDQPTDTDPLPYGSQPLGHSDAPQQMQQPTAARPARFNRRSDDQPDLPDQQTRQPERSQSRSERMYTPEEPRPAARPDQDKLPYRPMTVPPEQQAQPQSDAKARAEQVAAPRRAAAEAASSKQAQEQQPAEPEKENWLKSMFYAITGRKDEGDYYTAPGGNERYADGRTRFKRRNRKPVPLWLRAVLTSVGMTAFFTALICFIFTALMTGRIHYVGGGGRTAVRISGAERDTIIAEQTEETENTSEFTEPMTIAPSSKDVELILIVSSSRTLDATASSECDAVMLAAIDYKNHKLKLIPVMRDLYVRIDGYYSNRLSRAFYYDSAYGSYGLPTMLKAIEDNLGVVPDHYVIVDSNAFITLVTRIGGVQLELSEEEALYMSTDEKYGYFPRFTAGGNYLMSGAEALNYIRIKRVGNGEYDRTVRQRAVFEQIMERITDMSFVELCELTYAMLPQLPTDMTGGDMMGILMKARGIAGYENSYLTLPITGAWRDGTAELPTGQVDVMVTDFSFTADALQKYLYVDDESYINGTAASGVTIPDVAPDAHPAPEPEDEAPEDAPVAE